MTIQNHIWYSIRLCHLFKFWKQFILKYVLSGLATLSFLLKGEREATGFSEHVGLSGFSINDRNSYEDSFLRPGNVFNKPLGVLAQASVQFMPLGFTEHSVYICYKPGWCYDWKLLLPIICHFSFFFHSVVYFHLLRKVNLRAAAEMGGKG